MKSRAVFPFEFVITLGDNIYAGSEPSDFEKAIAVPYKPLLDGAPSGCPILNSARRGRVRSS